MTTHSDSPTSESATDHGGRRPEWVKVGIVGRAHGLDGSVWVDGAGDPERFRRGAKLRVGQEEVHTVAARGGTERRPLVRFVEVRDRTAAEGLRGKSLEIAGATLPDLEEGEYYDFELVGLQVVAEARRVGAITRVDHLPANDVLVINGGAMVPMTKDAVLEVDRDAREVRVDPAFVTE